VPDAVKVKSPPSRFLHVNVGFLSKTPADFINRRGIRDPDFGSADDQTNGIGRNGLPIDAEVKTGDCGNRLTL
jgi:hypothetical protein